MIQVETASDQDSAVWVASTYTEETTPHFARPMTAVAAGSPRWLTATFPNCRSRRKVAITRERVVMTPVAESMPVLDRSMVDEELKIFAYSSSSHTTAFPM